jgi:hypothetical protein
MTTQNAHSEADQRFHLMDTLLYLVIGCAMTMVSFTFLAWLRA